MMKNKPRKLTLSQIGTVHYNFDFAHEKNIYKYVSCEKMKNKEIDCLPEDIKFDTYKEWKNYIYDKYINFSVEELEEFIRYLNQRERRIRPFHNYWTIFNSVMLTIVLTELFKMICEINYEKIYQLTQYIWVNTIIYLFIMIVAVFIAAVVSMYITKFILTTFSDNDIEKNMLFDYREIISKMIEEKRRFDNEI